jgi:hypothetical protein
MQGPKEWLEGAVQVSKNKQGETTYLFTGGRVGAFAWLEYGEGEARVVVLREGVSDGRVKLQGLRLREGRARLWVLGCRKEFSRGQQALNHLARGRVRASVWLVEPGQYWSLGGLVEQWAAEGHRVLVSCPDEPSRELALEWVGRRTGVVVVVGGGEKGHFERGIVFEQEEPIMLQALARCS